MEATIFVFLLGGLFLGWSLGANDAANVFGTAVGTRMLRFSLAAVICSIFVILGAVASGAGAAHTLGKLGAINTIAGAGVAAASAAVTVYWKNRVGLPVSTSQAIVGAIIGWNLFTGSPTDPIALIKILSTWVACPLLAGIIGALLYKATVFTVGRAKLHLFRLDAYTRLALILAGAFGAYSLGANNIANVMGVFISSNPFTTYSFEGVVTFSATQQLFLLGGLAIAVGVFTYSKKVMMTVGAELVPMSPVGAWVVVVAHSIVLFLFASQGLEYWLADAGLPTIPLVPVSSSQAVVGALIGIGLLRGGRGIRWRVAGNIAAGWVMTPIAACALCFVTLFFVQNVFNQLVFEDSPYELSVEGIARLEAEGVGLPELAEIAGIRYEGLDEFTRALNKTSELSAEQRLKAVETARIEPIELDLGRFSLLATSSLSETQKRAVRRLAGRSFEHSWQLEQALADISKSWRLRPKSTVNKLYNRKLEEQRRELYLIFVSDNK